MKRKILQYGNKLLETLCEAIETYTKDTENIIKDLLDTANSIADKCAGLSAPQIGYLKRIIICRRVDIEQETDLPIWEVMINPEIVEYRDTKSEMYEGCLSINKGNLFGPVTRPDRVKVRYKDQSFEVKEMEASGLLSHIIQHEIDHLNGILFLKYIQNSADLITEKELNKRLNQQNGSNIQK